MCVYMCCMETLEAGGVISKAVRCYKYKSPPRTTTRVCWSGRVHVRRARQASRARPSSSACIIKKLGLAYEALRYYLIDINFSLGISEREGRTTLVIHSTYFVGPSDLR